MQNLSIHKKARTRVLTCFWVLVLLPLSAWADLDAIYNHGNGNGSPVLQLIQSAKKSLDIEIYEMTDPVVLNEIRKTVQRGVRVRIVKEAIPVGKTCKVFEALSSGDDENCELQKKLVKYVRSNGGDYVPYPRENCGIPGRRCFQHGKVVIVDQQEALLSTGNFSSSSLCHRDQGLSKCNRDYSFVTRDSKVVKSILSVFESDLRGLETRSPASFPSLSRSVTVSPFSMDPLLAFIQSAKKTILIQNQYLEEPRFNEALIQAAKRGVSVYVMVASVCSYGRPSPSKAKKFTEAFQGFDKAGVKSKIFTRRITVQGKRGYLHAKAMVVDQERGWMGSVNGSTTSFSSNREFGIFFDDPKDVSQLYRWMREDYVHPGTESWQESLDCQKDWT